MIPSLERSADSPRQCASVSASHEGSETHRALDERGPLVHGRLVAKAPVLAPADALARRLAEQRVAAEPRGERDVLAHVLGDERLARGQLGEGRVEPVAVSPEELSAFPLGAGLRIASLGVYER